MLLDSILHWRNQGALQPLPKQNLKNTNFLDIVSNVLHDLHFSLNQPPKLADDLYTGILKNIIKC
jgi:hypothetical protein